MKNISQTRWIGRAESIKAVWDSYEVLLNLLEELSVDMNNDRDYHLTASNLLNSIEDVDFYISLVFMKNILYKMKSDIRSSRNRKRRTFCCRRHDSC